MTMQGIPMVESQLEAEKENPSRNRGGSGSDDCEDWRDHPKFRVTVLFEGLKKHFQELTVGSTHS